MNLHKDKRHDDLLDVQLGNYLKNWSASIDPPPFGKQQLLSAARNQSSQIQQKSFFSFLVHPEIGEHFGKRNLTPDFEFSSKGDLH